MRTAPGLGQSHQRQPVPATPSHVSIGRVPVALEVGLRQLVRAPAHEHPHLVARAVGVHHRPQLDQVLAFAARVARVIEHRVDEAEAVQRLVPQQPSEAVDRLLESHRADTDQRLMQREDEPQRSAIAIGRTGGACASDTLDARWLGKREHRIVPEAHARAASAVAALAVLAVSRVDRHARERRTVGGAARRRRVTLRAQRPLVGAAAVPELQRVHRAHCEQLTHLSGEHADGLNHASAVSRVDHVRGLAAPPTAIARAGRLASSAHAGREAISGRRRLVIWQPAAEPAAQRRVGTCQCGGEWCVCSGDAYCVAWVPAGAGRVFGALARATICLRRSTRCTPARSLDTKS